MKIERIYALSCVVSALGWGSSVVGVLAPSEVAFTLLTRLGNHPIEHSVILDYWLRMCSLTFVFIGVLSALCIKDSYSTLRLPLGVFNIGCAMSLIVWNCIIGVQSNLQVIDPVFLLVAGIPMTMWACVKAENRPRAIVE